MSDSNSIWDNTEFRLYLSTTAFTGVAFAMQQLLLSWILIGVLELPATQVGIIQAATGIPGARTTTVQPSSDRRRTTAQAAG